MIDLTPFCDPTCSWPARPWSARGYTYACNGKIVVRVDGEQVNPPDATRLSMMVAQNLAAWLPTCSDYAGRLPPKAEWPAAGWAPCPACDGLGATKVCPDCNGTGIITCSHCGSGVECQKCRSGSIPCPPAEGEPCEDCGGKGRVPEDTPMRAPDWPAGLRLNAHHVALLATMPDLELATDRWSPNMPLAFRFAGGVGAIQPIQGE